MQLPMVSQIDMRELQNNAITTGLHPVHDEMQYSIAPIHCMT
jgi:hypothetical protein